MWKYESKDRIPCTLKNEYWVRIPASKLNIVNFETKETLNRFSLGLDEVSSNQKEHEQVSKMCMIVNNRDHKLLVNQL